MAAFTTRPVVRGRRGVVCSGHYLATAAGFRIMEQGGNAVDAAAAMCFCLNLLEPHQNGTGGEVPTLIYSAKEKRAYAVCGMGWSPKAFTVGWCRENDIDLVPGDGFLPACVPSVVDTWAAALARFGTKTFAEVLSPAIELAESGFPVYGLLHDFLARNRDLFRSRYPTTAEVYLPGGRVPDVGQALCNRDYAGTLRSMCEAEAKASGGSREAGIEAARDAFYKGDIARRLVEFAAGNPVPDASGKAHAGLLSLDDMAEWRASLEDPVTYNYRGFEVHKCPTWTQGPVFLQQLAVLEGFDLEAMGHNSAEYLHTIVEAAKLAFADREAYYGDPAFDEVPLGRLLSEGYNDGRRRLIGEEASGVLSPGDAGLKLAIEDLADVRRDNRLAMGLEPGGQGPGPGGFPEGDTTQLDAVDAEGNMVAATPSGGWLQSSPVVEGLGFPLGTRGQMFYLNPKRANALEPRKRPRATLTPSLVTRGGLPWMVFGTPGGDSQDQWTLEFFLNYVHFGGADGMNLQEALDAPTVHSAHFPSSFYPRAAEAKRVVAEERIPADVLDGLRERGHEVALTEAYANGKPMAVRFDADSGRIFGAVSARGSVGYALGW